MANYGIILTYILLAAAAIAAIAFPIMHLVANPKKSKTSRHGIRRIISRIHHCLLLGF